MNAGDFINAPRLGGQSSDGQRSESSGEEDEDFPAGGYHRLPLAGRGTRDPSAVPTVRVSQMLDSYLNTMPQWRWCMMT